MKQTPVHELHNADLLRLMPLELNNIVEVGCSSGAFAREYKKMNSQCHYIGIEIDSEYGELAKRYCDEVIIGDIEQFSSDFWANHGNADAWIFSDVLEHLRDPWACLKKIREIIPRGGCILACIPNVQHWSIQVQISTGNFRYQDIGLLDRTHLRWFTRKTIIELFESTGFGIEELQPRIFDDSRKDQFLTTIKRLASRACADPKEAMMDALPFQYLIRATPK